VFAGLSRAVLTPWTFAVLMTLWGLGCAAVVWLAWHAGRRDTEAQHRTDRSRAGRDDHRAA